MQVRGFAGRIELHPENDAEKAIIGKAFRDSKQHFASVEAAEGDANPPDPQKSVMLYWGDANLDGKETGAYIISTWDKRDYQLRCTAASAYCNGDQHRPDQCFVHWHIDESGSVLRKGQFFFDTSKENLSPAHEIVGEDEPDDEGKTVEVDKSYRHEPPEPPRETNRS